MKDTALKMFRDPHSNQPLTPEDMEFSQGNVIGGKLMNGQRSCVAKIKEGIPDFVGDTNDVSNWSLQWNQHASTQLDSVNGSTHTRDRLFETAQWPENHSLEGMTVLEAACGAGRFTEVLAEAGAEVFSFDYSEAVKANFFNNGHRNNVAIFKADVYAIPFPRESFDVVIGLGMLQHTPNPKRSFECLAEMVRPGGELVVDAYSSALRQRLHWKYVLRPFTKRMHPKKLYAFCHWYVPKLLPVASFLSRIARPLRRLIPVMDMSEKNVSRRCKREWSILDTYDALAAAHDHPQKAGAMRRWFASCGFADVCVRDGTVIRACGRKKQVNDTTC